MKGTISPEEAALLETLQVYVDHDWRDKEFEDKLVTILKSDETRKIAEKIINSR